MRDIISEWACLATTAIELDAELDAVVSAMESTDHSSTSIRSASNLFRKWAKYIKNLNKSSNYLFRFISLAPADLIDQPNFVNILNFYNNRGLISIVSLVFRYQYDWYVIID